MERETGFEPATLCLGIRSGLGPPPSTRVRRRVFARVWRNFAGPQRSAIVPLRPSVWLQHLPSFPAVYRRFVVHIPVSRL